MVWFIPDVLKRFQKDKQERELVVGCERGALAAGDVTCSHWRW